MQSYRKGFEPSAKVPVRVVRCPDLSKTGQKAFRPMQCGHLRPDQSRPPTRHVRLGRWWGGMVPLDHQPEPMHHHRCDDVLTARGAVQLIRLREQSPRAALHIHNSKEHWRLPARCRDGNFCQAEAANKSERPALRNFLGLPNEQQTQVGQAVLTISLGGPAQPPERQSYVGPDWPKFVYVKASMQPLDPSSDRLVHRVRSKATRPPQVRNLLRGW